MTQELTQRSLTKIGIALAIYLTSLVAANTLGLKLMPFLFGTHLSVAVFSFPFVFLMTDIVGEVYGKSVARMFVLAGFVTVALFILFSVISLLVPWSKDALWVKEGYNTVFGVSLRISIASLLAFLVAEYQDVVSFFFFRAKTGGRHFWLRSTLSNIWSQFLDTVIFMFVAFLGVYSLPTLLSIIVPWWLYKVAMGVLYTPLSYAGMYFLREHNEEKQSTR